MNEDTDTIPGLAGTVREAEDRIRDRFNATEADIDSDHDGVTIGLRFRGFTDLDTALKRVGEVARELNEYTETTSVHTGVSTAGGYDPRTDETDVRPVGGVGKRHARGRTVTGEPTDGWSYAGITSHQIAATDPLAVDVVHAVQQREASGGGDYLHRRVTLAEENRVGPAEGGSRDHRELDGDLVFEQAGVITDHRDGLLTETTGVVMAEVGFQVDKPRWYWEPIEHATAADLTEAAP